MVCYDWCGLSGMASAELWARTYQTRLVWTGTLTVDQAFLPNINAWPDWRCCGWMGRNFHSQNLRSSLSRRAEVIIKRKGGLNLECYIYIKHTWVWLVRKYFVNTAHQSNEKDFNCLEGGKHTGLFFSFLTWYLLYILGNVCVHTILWI